MAKKRRNPTQKSNASRRRPSRCKASPAAIAESGDAVLGAALDVGAADPRLRSKDPSEVVAGYMAGVLDGTIPACNFIRQAVERHQRDLLRGSARGLTFDESAARRVVTFFGFLKHSKGEWYGKPFELSPWQVFILWVLFGWKWQASGLRRFRVAYIELPRKNGKSTLVAGIGLYLLVADGEGGAEIYTAATKKEQARIVHSEAMRMVRASPELSSLIQRYHSSLSVEATNSKYEPIGANSETQDGLNPHGVLVDELHAHPNGDLWDVLDTAMGARRQPLMLAITTAGRDGRGVCWEQRERAVKALSTVSQQEVGFDDSFFGFVATIDEGDDWRSPAASRKANPNYGISVKPDYLARQMAKAEKTPRVQNSVKRLHLNLWTAADCRWLDARVWAGGCDRPVAWSEWREQLRGMPCTSGLDLSTKFDLTTAVHAFRTPNDTFRLAPRFWIPEETAAEREKEDRIPYLYWAEQGFVTLTPGDTIDYDFVERDLQADFDFFQIRQLAFDPWNANHTATRLATYGFKMVEFAQTIRNFTEICKEFEAWVKSRRVEHNAHPILAWNAENITVKTDASGNVRPVKPEHGDKKRIDGIVAGLMALWGQLGAKADGCGYDDHDIRELEF